MVSLLAGSFTGAAQEQDIAISLHTPDYYSGTKGRSITSVRELQVWCVNSKPDRILYEVNSGKRKKYL